MAASRRPAVLLALVLLVLPGRPGQAGQGQPGPGDRPAPPAPNQVFRTATRLIVHTVTVKDKNGQPVEGLTAADFTLTEDGRPQQLAFVEYQRLAAAGDRGGTEADVPPEHSGDASLDGGRLAGGGLHDAAYRDKRLLILYFDLTSMPPSDRMRAFAGARRYIDREMSSSDAVAVMTFDGGPVRVRQDFTGNREALRAEIDRLMTGGDADGDGVPDDPEEGSAFGENDSEFNIFTTDRQLSALQTAAQTTETIGGQKALLYFGSGFRLSGADNRAQLRATVNAAVRANVRVHPVDARGLVAVAPMGDATRASPGGQGMFSGSVADAILARLQRSQDAFFALARDTGGSPFLDHNDLSLGIAQAAQELTSYYVLGYYSSHPATDGQFRRVRVTVRGSREIQVSHRDGYFAERRFERLATADKERQLEDALKREDPITEIRIAAELNFFRLNRAEYFVPVSVRIPGGDLTAAGRGNAMRTRLDVIGEVKDDHGITHRNVRDKVEIQLTAENVARLPEAPIRYETGFSLLPGRYAIKLLVRDATTGRLGTYESPFEIPNLDRQNETLPVSSVVLSTQRLRPGSATVQVRQKGRNDSANPLTRDGQTIVPSVTRVFRRDSDLSVLLEAYPGAQTTSVVAFVSLFRGETKAWESAAIVASRPEPGSRAIAVRATVPLHDLAPGRYECQVTVLDPQDQRAAFRRTAIAIRP
jgi:VWFA-related protein